MNQKEYLENYLAEVGKIQNETGSSYSNRKQVNTHKKIKQWGSLSKDKGANLNKELSTAKTGTI